MQFSEINICRMIFIFYTFYKNRDNDKKIGDPTREKLHVLEKFCCRLYVSLNSLSFLIAIFHFYFSLLKNIKYHCFSFLIISSQLIFFISKSYKKKKLEKVIPIASISFLLKNVDSTETHDKKSI